MAVASTSTTTNSTGASQALLDSMNTKSTKASATSADADKFMTLLITQLKNQDPLNPLDNAQVTSQLAQLNTVTGVNKLNETLESLKADYAASTSAQAVNLIDHGVLAAGNGMTVSEGKAIFGVELGSYADSLQIDVKDSAGKVVHSITMNKVDAGVLPLAWDGKLSDGKTTADGKYSLVVTATAAGKTLTDAKPLTFGTVASVSTGPTGAKLNVPSIGQLTMDDIKQVL
ncbi:flagellar basal-body rod modification protein FlgD [Pseudoduganella flava]|uniref:Basal-body rod modification protein FlgD n=1 Tax=Pseudoduganella flava TaxID=871742 RepID=A0A562PSL8_9BURK|nr:flagellar hook assembly protein FlgD [Pseudoduganella flava]QGZ39259.1 flagellar biosynthesis protein FlgD [Pseudoduganella flava]TWI47441.1 flagellar basal-body rod modification protein FlgD [Pseudoduganella flava]